MLGKGFFLTESNNPDLPPEEWTLFDEKTVAGTYVFALPWGRYRFEISAAGGGAGVATAWGGRAGASGGAGAYGSFIREINVGTTETFTAIIGVGGNGATVSNGTAATTSGGSTTVSSSEDGLLVTLNGGNGGYAHATTNGDTAYVGSGGTFTTILTEHNFNNGTNGVFATTHSGDYSSGNTTNPSPYDNGGYGGSWYYNKNMTVIIANNGGDGFVRIYKSNIKPLKEEVYYAWGSNPSVKETRVFTENLNPQVGDPAWFFGFDNTRTSYDIKDATQVTIQSSGTGVAPIVWVNNTGFYAAGTLGPSIYTLNRMSNDDIIIKW